MFGGAEYRLGHHYLIASHLHIEDDESCRKMKIILTVFAMHLQQDAVSALTVTATMAQENQPVSLPAERYAPIEAGSSGEIIEG